MDCIRVGLLPFYLKMHDDLFPERRAEVGEYLRYVVKKLEMAGLSVVSASLCREKAEFEKAVDMLNREAPEAVITLHVVYSPSLESIEALKKLEPPIIVLDTTPDWDFGEKRLARMVRPNIGIHGVQDMCSLLVRNNIKFRIAAGHLEHSGVLEKVVKYCRAAKAAKVFRTAKIGSIGGSYKGMGDFLITPERMKAETGAEIIKYDFAKDNLLAEGIRREDIENEIAQDRERYVLFDPVDEDYRESTKACLLTRKWIENNGLSAFTVNFTGIDKASGFPRVPFMEASKGMARGVGYAGEGDTLTAGLVGALLSIYPETSFTEMFCPGWSNNTVFLSHMGEINLELCKEKTAVSKKKMPFTDSGDIACAYGRFKPGRAVLVNLAPLQKGLRLILAPVEMLDMGGNDDMAGMIEGWFRPDIPLANFLESFSLAGGTHHSAVCYNAGLSELRVFGEMMGFDVRVIE